MNRIQDNHEATCDRLNSARLKAHWRFKLITGTLLTIGFYTFYFLILYFPVFPVTEMPVTSLDRLVGFWSTSLLIYITLWIYISLGALLLNDKRELISYVIALSVLGTLGLAVFFFWPTSVPRPSIDVTEYPSFTLVVALDEPRNVFPSLHAAFAIFTAICLGRLMCRLECNRFMRALNWCWCLAIIYSAMATKQHMAVDLLGGTILGTIWAGLYLRFVARRFGGTVDALGASPAGAAILADACWTGEFEERMR